MAPQYSFLISFSSRVIIVTSNSLSKVIAAAPMKDYSFYSFETVQDPLERIHASGERKVFREASVGTDPWYSRGHQPE